MFLERPSHSVNLRPCSGAWRFTTVNDPHGTVKVPFGYGHGIAFDCGSVSAARPLFVSEAVFERVNNVADVLSHNQPPLLRQYLTTFNICQIINRRER